MLIFHLTGLISAGGLKYFPVLPGLVCVSALSTKSAYSYRRPTVPAILISTLSFCCFWRNFQKVRTGPGYGVWQVAGQV